MLIHSTYVAIALPIIGGIRLVELTSVPRQKYGVPLVYSKSLVDAGCYGERVCRLRLHS